MVYLIATYIREDRIDVTRATVLWQGYNIRGAKEAFAQEIDAQLDEGSAIIEDGERVVVMRCRAQYGTEMYTIILQIEETAGKLPYYNE